MTTNVGAVCDRKPKVCSYTWHWQLHEAASAAYSTSCTFAPRLPKHVEQRARVPASFIQRLFCRPCYFPECAGGPGTGTRSSSTPSGLQQPQSTSAATAARAARREPPHPTAETRGAKNTDEAQSNERYVFGTILKDRFVSPDLFSAVMRAIRSTHTLL